ncbi:MAG TPA: RND transporter, partial [Phenylobacterium sp.]|nr:RND transporter [Phenylobacterium sp.]
MRLRASSALVACLAIPACLTLGACAHVRPADKRMPAAFETLASNGASRAPAGSIDLDRWWLAFKDPELTGLIEQALRNN